MKTATLMLMGTMMIASVAAAGPASHDMLRPSPRPVSPTAIFGITHDLRALSTIETVRIAMLPVSETHYGVATVPVVVEPRMMVGAVYVARISTNGESVSERRIAAGSSVILEAAVRADGATHSIEVSVHRLQDGGEPVHVATRSFVVSAPAGQY